MKLKNENYTTLTTESKIKFEEKGKKIIFINSNRLSYKKIQVDGGILTDGIRCDNLLLSQDEKSEYYIELKGKDVQHAIEQIDYTICRIGEFNDNRHAFIISTKVSPAIDTIIQRGMKHFRKKHNSSLFIKERYHEVNLY